MIMIFFWILDYLKIISGIIFFEYFYLDNVCLKWDFIFFILFEDLVYLKIIDYLGILRG